MSDGCSEIIVAGFHRSGTSSVTQLLHTAGLFVGDALIGANKSNPYGHYEDREVVSIHNQILDDNGLNWQVTEPIVPVIAPARWAAMEKLVERRRIAHRLWGFKDPRACLFLSEWKHLLPDAKVLIVFRRPTDSAYSLIRRHADEMFRERGSREIHARFFTVPDLALRMWLAHNRALITYARQHPDDVLAVSFESLLRGLPLTRLARIAWDAPLQEVPTFTAIDPLVTTRRDNPQPIADPALAEALTEVWNELSALETQALASTAR